MMSIEELVDRLRTAVLAWDNEWSMNGDGPDIRDAMLPILTELSETHAQELRAHEATVANLEQRIKDLQLELLANGEFTREPFAPSCGGDMCGNRWLETGSPWE